MTLVVALVVFFLSGAAALIYQVSWQRILVIFSGADVYSATLVVAAFMAGLGCGSWVGGRLADRVGMIGSLLLFFAAEAGIALFGIFSTTLLYDGLYHRWGHLAEHPAVMASLMFAVLLWPTSLMGASLPLLARALTHRLDLAARTIGWLYGVNTIGAAAGALVTTWVLLRAFGIEGSVMIAVLLNVIAVVSVGALVVFLKPAPALPAPTLRQAQGRPEPSRGASERQRVEGSERPRVEGPIPDLTPNGPVPDPTPSVPDLSPAHGSMRVWLAFSALAGFIALSFEIVWFRVLGVMLKSTAFTFGTLLAQYLFWLGMGSLLGGSLARRSARPGRLFLILQAAAALYGGLSLALYVNVFAEVRGLAPLVRYFAEYEPFHPGDAIANPDLQVWFLKLYVVLPAAMIGPATFLSGLSFPILQKAVHTELAGLGRRVGALMLANIAGSTLGAMLTGWLLLGLLGTAGTLRFLVACSLAFVAPALRMTTATRRSSRLATLTAASVTAVVIVAMPGEHALWARLHGSPTDRVLIAEDSTGVSVLQGAHPSFAGPVRVVVNGLGQSWIPYAGIHTVLGALPAFLHPLPRTAAIIGLGSGDTLFAMAGRPELERLTSIEIVKPQIDTLAALVKRRPYPGVLTVLQDPRIAHVFGDGRRYLKHTDRTFDILEADALRPSSAYAGNLYSKEYFELLRARLNPGGLAVTWAPTSRVEATFLRVFPFVLKYDAVLIGSGAPIHVDRAAIRERINAISVIEYYARAGVNILELLDPLIGSGQDLTSARAGATDLNTDLHPKDEFGIIPAPH